MPSTETTYPYPKSMKRLPWEIRMQAIEIANAMLEDFKDMDEKQLIKIAIRRAKCWMRQGNGNQS